jgi:hypothetical protein
MSKEIERFKRERKKGYAYLALLWLLTIIVLAVGLTFFPPKDTWQICAGFGLLIFPIFLTGMVLGIEMTQRIFKKELCDNL